MIQKLFLTEILFSTLHSIIFHRILFCVKIHKIYLPLYNSTLERAHSQRPNSRSMFRSAYRPQEVHSCSKLWSNLVTYRRARCRADCPADFNFRETSEVDPRSVVNIHHETWSIQPAESSNRGSGKFRDVQRGNRGVISLQTISRTISISWRTTRAATARAWSKVSLPAAD